MSYIDNIDSMQYKKRLKDYSILAFACKRANNHRNEGRAYYSCGVLYDNLGQYHKAIKWYEKFLNVCQRIGDNHGIALCYNCIGISYQRLGEKDLKYYKKAVEYHEKHLNCSDVKGKFIASINLGLLHGLMGDVEKADVHNKTALSYAAQVSSLRGQAAIIGNLGRIGTNNMITDTRTLKTYAEKYLKLSHEIKHKQGEAEAHIQLAKIEQTLGNHTKSIEDYTKARNIAKEIGNLQCENEASIGLGIVKAESNWNNKANEILKSINAEKTLF